MKSFLALLASLPLFLGFCATRSPTPRDCLKQECTAEQEIEYIFTRLDE